MKMPEKRTYRMEAAGQRLDKYLSSVLEGFSRAHIQRLIQSGDVLVDDMPCKANYKSRGGEYISICLPDPEPAEIEPEAIPLDILYEDEDIIVLNKARGMVVHPAAGNHSGTLVNALLYHCKDLSGINGVIRPGIVHRLDKDTSGVMVAAKNDQAHLCLAEQIRKKEARRTYLAVVCGNITEDRGVIKGAIGRDPHERKRMAIVEGGKKAVTHFRVLERFASYTYIECILETGRTHQIRVHLASIGYPLAGDPKYGIRKNPFAIQGQALHSHTLDLRHPRTSKLMHFEAPLPEDMKKILSRLRDYQSGCSSRL